MCVAQVQHQLPEVCLITISFNGESREVPENLSLQALLAWLNLPADRVAVERNLEIVPRRSWEETTIEAGDRLEVVHFVGGGLCVGRTNVNRATLLLKSMLESLIRTTPVALLPGVAAGSLPTTSSKILID
jgi:sulfur carrier protein